MTDRMENGFHFLSRGKDEEFLRVDSDTLDRLPKYVEKIADCGLSFSRYSGYRENDLKLLTRKEFAAVRRIHIQDPIQDISALYQLPSMRKLWISTAPGGVDLTHFPLLEELEVEWNKNVAGFDALRNLNALILRKYLSPSGGLSNLRLPSRVKSLRIIQGNINNLSGLEHLPIERLMLAYLPKLVDLSVILSFRKSLTKLNLDTCKRVSGINPLLASLTALQTLRLSSIAPMPDLSFVPKLSVLKFFSFVHTEVEDGDMAWLLKHPTLERVGFLRKRNFSHSYEEICAALANRSDKSKSSELRKPKKSASK